MSLPEFVTVWVCHDCGNYYASSSVDDLRTEFNTDIKGDVTFARARCPTMMCAEREVMRIPMQLPLGRSQPSTPESAPSDNDLPRWSNRRCDLCDKVLIETSEQYTCSGCGTITSTSR